MKIAVIGTGMAGYGAYLAMKNAGSGFDTTFFNAGKSIPKLELEYSILPGTSFPEKKEFGARFSSIPVANSQKTIRTSNTTGGLSDFWSCSSFPFPNYDLGSRSLQELKAAYKTLSYTLRMAGTKDDPLTAIFHNPFAYKYTIPTPAHFEQLNFLSKENLKSDFKFTVGDNRILLSSNETTKCTACGNCFKGCSEGFLMRPSTEIVGANVVNIRVHKIERIKTHWNIYNEDNELCGSYDNIFLGLGVYETICLLVRSNLIESSDISLYDSNAIFFPVYFQKHKSESPKGSFGFANKVIAVQDLRSEDIKGHLLITPFNHFFSYSLFGKLLGKILSGLLFNRVALATYYSNARLSNEYYIDNFGRVSIKTDNTSNSKRLLAKMISDVNSRKLGFKFLNVTKTFDSSSHYSSNLLVTKSSIYETSKLANNLFIIDGNLFPGPPPASPGSLNILAGAYVVVTNFVERVNAGSPFENQSSI